jgi:hypothetical protein
VIVVEEYVKDVEHVKGIKGGKRDLKSYLIKKVT